MAGMCPTRLSVRDVDCIVRVLRAAAAAFLSSFSGLCSSCSPLEVSSAPPRRRTKLNRARKGPVLFSYLARKGPVLFFHLARKGPALFWCCFCSSYAGLTRVSMLRCRIGCRVKPGNDE